MAYLAPLHSSDVLAFNPSRSRLQAIWKLFAEQHGKRLQQHFRFQRCAPLQTTYSGISSKRRYPHFCCLLALQTLGFACLCDLIYTIFEYATRSSELSRASIATSGPIANTDIARLVASNDDVPRIVGSVRSPHCSGKGLTHVALSSVDPIATVRIWSELGSRGVRAERL